MPSAWAHFCPLADRARKGARENWFPTFGGVLLVQLNVAYLSDIRVEHSCLPPAGQRVVITSQISGQDALVRHPLLPLFELVVVIPSERFAFARPG